MVTSGPVRVILSVVACLVRSEVVDLGDESFEKETQSTSGATTGDWFVRFCPAECDNHWKSVLNELADKLDEFDDKWINIAKVDGELNPEISERFNVTDTAKNLLFVKGTARRWQNSFT